VIGMASALLFLSRLLAPSERGTRIADAREALGYWSRRERELSWRRRAERREARARLTASRAELAGAHLERLGLGAVEPRLAPLLDTRGRSGGAHVRSLAFTSMRRTALGRRILLGAAGMAAACVAMLALAIALATHLIA
jgi:hypothetical protein